MPSAQTLHAVPDGGSDDIAAPDYGLWLLGAAVNAPAGDVLAVADWLRFDDFELPTDRIIWTHIVNIAGGGVAPTGVLVGARLDSDGVHGRQQQRRMLDVVTSEADGLALRSYGLAVVQAACRRVADAGAEGIQKAAGDGPLDDLMGVFVQAGRRLRALDERREQAARACGVIA